MKSSISVVYADFSEVSLSTGKHLTEITWIVEDVKTENLVPHHYFIDYPGAKESERAITAIVGGTPLVRYSAPTVLKAFFDGLPVRAIVAFKNVEAKKTFQKYLTDNEIEKLTSLSYRTFCIYEDVVMDDAEAAFIADIISDTKTEAAKKFGNAL